MTTTNQTTVTYKALIGVFVAIIIAMGVASLAGFQAQTNLSIHEAGQEGTLKTIDHKLSDLDEKFDRLDEKQTRQQAEIIQLLTKPQQ